MAVNANSKRKVIYVEFMVNFFSGSCWIMVYMVYHGIGRETGDLTPYSR